MSIQESKGRNLIGSLLYLHYLVKLQGNHISEICSDVKLWRQDFKSKNCCAIAIRMAAFRIHLEVYRN